MPSYCKDSVLVLSASTYSVEEDTRETKHRAAFRRKAPICAKAARAVSLDPCGDMVSTDAKSRWGITVCWKVSIHGRKRLHTEQTLVDVPGGREIACSVLAERLHVLSSIPYDVKRQATRTVWMSADSRAEALSGRRLPLCNRFQ